MSNTMPVSNDAACNADFWAQTFGTCIDGALSADIGK
jgi:hypothetical protein